MLQPEPFCPRLLRTWEITATQLSGIITHTLPKNKQPVARIIKSMSHLHCAAFDANNRRKPSADARVVVSGHTICAAISHQASSRSQLQNSRLTSPGICCEKTFLKGERKMFPFVFEKFKQLCLRKPSHAKLCTNDNDRDSDHSCKTSRHLLRKKHVLILFQKLMGLGLRQLLGQRRHL